MFHELFFQEAISGLFIFELEEARGRFNAIEDFDGLC